MAELEPHLPSSARTIRHDNPQTGFSIVELAIVLLVVGLLIGGMILPLSAQQEIRQRQGTEASLIAVREAIYGFAATNGRLPRPATSASDGQERAGLCSTSDPDDCNGFIPWATLGTPRSDEWGKLLRYSVTPALANGAIAFDYLADRRVQTDNAVYLVGGATCTASTPCAAAIIFSQGKNGYGTTESNVAIANSSATNVDELSNDTATTKTYISRSPTTNTAGTGGEFDDIVIWLPSTTLFARLVASGKL